MIDLGALVIDQEANAVVDVYTKTGQYVDGKWIEGAHANPTSIRAVIQPAGGRKLQDLPEGVRAQAQHFLWTRFELALDHVVLYAGSEWRVVFAWPRRVEAGYTRVAIGKLK